MPVDAHARRCWTALQPGSRMSCTVDLALVPGARHVLHAAAPRGRVDVHVQRADARAAEVGDHLARGAEPRSRRSSNARSGRQRPAVGQPLVGAVGVGHRARRRRCRGGAVSGCSGERAMARKRALPASRRAASSSRAWPSASSCCRFRSCTTDRSAASPKPSSGANSTGATSPSQSSVSTSPSAASRARKVTCSRACSGRSAKAGWCTCTSKRPAVQPGADPHPREVDVRDPPAREHHRLRLGGRWPGVDVGPGRVCVGRRQDHAPGDGPRRRRRPRQ